MQTSYLSALNLKKEIQLVESVGTLLSHERILLIWLSWVAGHKILEDNEKEKKTIPGYQEVYQTPKMIIKRMTTDKAEENRLIRELLNRFYKD